MASARDGWVIVAAALSLLAAVPATAAVKRAIFTGTVKSGIDSFGLFGEVGADLAGKTYTSRILYDPARPADPRYYLGSNYFFAGEAYAPYAPDPWSMATLRINGRAFEIDPRRSGIDLNFNRRDGALALHYLNFYYGRIYSELAFTSVNSPTLTTLDGNLARSELNRGRFGNSFRHEQYDDNGDLVSSMIVDLGDRTFLTITDVPEPATWAMLVIGFGLVGTTLRRRNHRYVSASHQG